MRVENLTKKGYFENISFNVERGEKICFLSSKSTTTTMLYQCIMGEERADSGTVTFGKTIIPAYMPVDYSSYFDGCTLNLVQWISQFTKETFEEYLRGWLGRMLFSGEEALKEAQVLSGGEKVRCMLARMMLAGANFMIFDEPTNHLDLESITALNKGMINFKGNLLFTTHDQEICSTVANRVIEIEETKTFDKLISYEDYLDARGM